jgi:hypothetical protein
MMLVHDAQFESVRTKQTTVVRVTSGRHMVRSDPNSDGVFQQALHLTVEQGTQTIDIDLLNSFGSILASLELRPLEDVLNRSVDRSEHTFVMESHQKGILNPKIKLTMVVDDLEIDESDAVCVATDVDNLVRMHLAKAKREQASSGEDTSEIGVLQKACQGPLERFQGLGSTCQLWVSVLGPPASRRWALGLWRDREAFTAGKEPMEEIDLLKLKTVQADPARHHVFFLQYYDENRVRQSCGFRRTDRGRDVWVECIYLLVQKVHELRDASKQQSMRRKSMSRKGTCSSTTSGEFRNLERPSASTDRRESYSARNSSKEK